MSVLEPFGTSLFRPIYAKAQPSGMVGHPEINFSTYSIIQKVALPTGGPYDFPLELLWIHGWGNPDNPINEWGQGWTATTSRRVAVSEGPYGWTQAILYTGEGVSYPYGPNPPGTPLTPAPNADSGLQQVAGNFVETASDGSEYLYKPHPMSDVYLLSRVTNAGGARWTIVRDVPDPPEAPPYIRYVVGPMERRTSFSYDGSGKVRRVTDPAGRVTTFAYQNVTRVRSIEAPDLSRTTYVYEFGSRLNGYIDPMGSRTTYGYFGVLDAHPYYVISPRSERTTFGFLLTDKLRHWIIDPRGYRTTYVLNDFPTGQDFDITDPYGNQTKWRPSGLRPGYIVTPMGHRATLGYEEMTSTTEARRLGVVHLPSGGQFTNLFDSEDRLGGIIEENGNRSTLIWSGNLRTGLINALGQRMTYTYNSRGQMVSTIDPDGDRTTNVYDSVGQIIADINPLGYRTSYSFDNAGQLRRVTDPLGNITTSIHDVMNRKIAEVNALGARTSSLYDKAGRRTAVIDALGNRTTTLFDSTGWEKATINALGRRTTYGYDSAGNRRSVTDPLGNIRTSVYDSLNRKVADVTPSGSRTTYVYNADGRMVAVKNPIGNRWTSVYDAYGRVLTSVDPLAHRTSHLYDAVGNRKASIDARGNRTSYLYDALHRQVAAIDPLNYCTTAVFGNREQPIAQVNAMGDRTTFLYDDASQPIAIVDALGNRTTALYDANGRAYASVNARGYRNTTIYDAAGRSVATIDALANRTTSAYDLAGHPIRTISALGYISTTVYHSASQVIALVDPLGNRASYIYDAAGQQVATISPLGNRKTLIYDSDQRLYSTVNPLGYRTTYGYNAAGQQVSTLDANGTRSTMVYDNFGRRIADISALGNRTTQVYDPVGNRIAIIDAKSNRNTFSYNARNEETLRIDPLLSRTTYAYNPVGSRSLRIDARGSLTTYLYDPMRQLTQRRYPDGSRDTFAYDPNGNMSSMANSADSTQWQYDEVDRITVMNATSRRLTYTYNAIGQRATMRDPESITISYMYDLADRMTLVTVPRTTFVFDADGRTVAQRNQNGTRSSFTHDNAGQITEIFHQKSDSTVFSSMTYTYDPVGNRTLLVELDGARTTWIYDDACQLTGGRRNGPTTTVTYDTTYTYDPLGNRLRLINDGVCTTYTYNSANQMLTSLDVAGITTFAFDADGNQYLEHKPNGDRTTNTWDYENRLSAVQLPAGGIETYSYNPANLRIARVASSVGLVRYIWDFLNIYEGYDESNSSVEKYFYKPQRYGELVAAGTSSYSYSHFDALGSVVALTNSSGDLMGEYIYSPFGTLVFQSVATANTMLFVARLGYYSDTVDRYYIRARHYAAPAARWLSVDPTESSWSDSWSMPLRTMRNSGILRTALSFRQAGLTIEEEVNRYSYGRNRPVLLTDASGLDVTNDSDQLVYVLIDGVWTKVLPGTTIAGETDAICPAQPAKGENGKPICIKIIDCFNANVQGPDEDGRYAIVPVYVGGARATGARYLCCISRLCTFCAVIKAGAGPVNPDDEFKSNPYGL